MRGVIIRFIVALVFLAIIILWYKVPDDFFVQYASSEDSHAVQKTMEEQQKIAEKKEKLEKERQEKEKQKKEQEASKKESMQTRLKIPVPFVVQAPHAQWEDPHYQDACEEASLVMADAWLNNERSLSKNEAEKRIEKMFAQQKEMFGDAVDTSAEDTAKFFRTYYGHNVEVVHNVTMSDLYGILANGHVILAPTNGKRLNNPHFTNGGPERHMVVIIGFDKKNNEFITNDPGTRVGRGYKYKDATLYNAIRDYNTGNKEEITNPAKTIIVVK